MKSKISSSKVKVRHILAWLDKNIETSLCFIDDPERDRLHRAFWLKEELGGHMIVNGWDLMQKGAVKDWEPLETYALKVRLKIGEDA